MEKEVRKHTFNYDGGVISATGVASVKELGDREISAELDSSSLTIRGEGLKITDFNMTSGILKLQGKLHSVQYGAPSESFFKRLLK